MSAKHKSVLRNVVKHVDTHNRITEETAMWRQRDVERKDFRNNQDRSRRRNDDADKHRSDLRLPRAHMDIEEDRQLRETKEKEKSETIWKRRKEARPEPNSAALEQKPVTAIKTDKWEHSGYCELYPEEFGLPPNQSENTSNVNTAFNEKKNTDGRRPFRNRIGDRIGEHKYDNRQNRRRGFERSEVSDGEMPQKKKVKSTIIAKGMDESQIDVKQLKNATKKENDVRTNKQHDGDKRKENDRRGREHNGSSSNVHTSPRDGKKRDALKSFSRERRSSPDKKSTSRHRSRERQRSVDAKHSNRSTNEQNKSSERKRNSYSRNENSDRQEYSNARRRFQETPERLRKRSSSERQVVAKFTEERKVEKVKVPATSFDAESDDDVSTAARGKQEIKTGIMEEAVNKALFANNAVVRAVDVHSETVKANTEKSLGRTVALHKAGQSSSDSDMEVDSESEKNKKLPKSSRISLHDNIPLPRSIAEIGSSLSRDSRWEESSKHVSTSSVSFGSNDETGGKSSHVTFPILGQSTMKHSKWHTDSDNHGDLAAFTSSVIESDRPSRIVTVVSKASEVEQVSDKKIKDNFSDSKFDTDRHSSKAPVQNVSDYNRLSKVEQNTSRGNINQTETSSESSSSSEDDDDKKPASKGGDIAFYSARASLVPANINDEKTEKFNSLSMPAIIQSTGLALAGVVQKRDEQDVKLTNESSAIMSSKQSESTVGDKTASLSKSTVDKKSDAKDVAKKKTDDNKKEEHSNRYEVTNSKRRNKSSSPEVRNRKSRSRSRQRDRSRQSSERRTTRSRKSPERSRRSRDRHYDRPKRRSPADRRERSRSRGRNRDSSRYGRRRNSTDKRDTRRGDSGRDRRKQSPVDRRRGRKRSSSSSSKSSGSDSDRSSSSSSDSEKSTPVKKQTESKKSPNRSTGNLASNVKKNSSGRSKSKKSSSSSSSESSSSDSD